MAGTPVGSASAHLGSAIRRVNDLRESGLLRQWAIGGAFAFMYYSEPVLSYDIDVFCMIPSQDLLVSLTPIYDRLRSQGYEPEHETVLIEGIPIQFLDVAPGSLEEDAVLNATEIVLDGTPARVFSMEHAVAIALKTNRRKDRERIAQLLESGTAKVDEEKLHYLLRRFSGSGTDLLKRWEALKNDNG